MNREHFEKLVAEALSALPEEFLEQLENIEIVLEDNPNRQQLNEGGFSYKDTLLGLYEGVPLTNRGSHYGLVPPDKISIFQRPIERYCHNDAEVKKEVERVVRHEIAHYFGMDDDRLDELGL
jgi:predicted Zn-dependent protease with MMP-like domain